MVAGRDLRGLWIGTIHLCDSQERAALALTSLPFILDRAAAITRNPFF